MGEVGHYRNVEEKQEEKQEERGGVWLYSHSVVPGGLDVRSYITLEIPGIFFISLTIFSTTCRST